MGYNDYVYLYFASKQENKGIKKITLAQYFISGIMVIRETNKGMIK